MPFTVCVTSLPQCCALGDPHQHTAGLAPFSSLEWYLGNVEAMPKYDVNSTGLSQ